MGYQTRKMTFVAVLAAIAVALRYVAITVLTPNNRLVFHNIPIMIGGMIFGPFTGGLIAILADIGAMPIIGGAFNPLFWIPQILWGVVPGLLVKTLNPTKVKNLVVIETLTHISVSFANTMVFWYLFGRNVALGTIRTGSFRFGFMFINREWAFSFGEVVHLRIAVVIVLMLIKIPIDVYLLNTLQKRVLSELDFYPFQERKKIAH